MKLVEPVGYLDSIGLADAAACVLTDSGGLQEETTFLRVPCLTLRPEHRAARSRSARARTA